jgi:hypothetical protein
MICVLDTFLHQILWLQRILVKFQQRIALKRDGIILNTEGKFEEPGV